MLPEGLKYRLPERLRVRLFVIYENPATGGIKRVESPMYYLQGHPDHTGYCQWCLDYDEDRFPRDAKIFEHDEPTVTALPPEVTVFPQ